MPVLAQRAMARRFSIARMIANRSCCSGPGVFRYQPSLVTIVRKFAPESTNFRTTFG